MESSKPQLIDIVKISDPRGNLSVLQYPSTLPFEPVRAYWIHDVPSGMMRHGHAFYSAQELIVALSGRIEVSTESPDGSVKRFTLSRPDQALYVPPMTWRELDNFATNSAVLIVSNRLYDEMDYIRDKNVYNNLVNEETENND